MVVTQKYSLRKQSGGRYKSARPKRLSQSGNHATLTSIGSQRTRTSRGRAGAVKKGLLSTDTVNLFDPKSGKHTKAKLISVKESLANRNYVRRNIIIKGTVVETDKGAAKVTNRPGQEKMINAILQ